MKSAEVCEWDIDDADYDSITWAADCGPAFDFPHSGGGPTDHGFKHCPFCGRALTEVETPEEAES